MELASAIYTVLVTDVDVSALVGTRVYPEQVPQGSAFPYITFLNVTSSPIRSLSGYSGVTKTMLQVDCFADDKATVVALKDAVRVAIGDRNNWQQAGLVVQSSQLDAYRDTSERPFDGGERMVRRVSMDFIVFWQDEPI